MLNKFNFLCLIILTISINSFGQQANISKEAIALKKKSALLNLEQMVTKSFKKTGINKRKVTPSKTQKSTLKKATNKLELVSIDKTPKLQKNKSLALTTVLSKTNGRKKIVKHTTVKTRNISKKTHLDLKKILQSKE